MAEKHEYETKEKYGLSHADPGNLSLTGSRGIPLGPGAYSVTMRPAGERPVWSHNTDSPYRLDAAPSEHSIDLEDDESIRGISASVTMVSPPPIPEPFQCRPKIFLGWLLLLGVVGLAVGLRLGLKSSGSDGVGDTTQGSLKKLPCQIDLESEFNSGGQPDLDQQCQCIGSISYLQPEVVSTYKELRATFIPGVNKRFDEETNSCQPSNLALTWLAMDNVNGVQRSTLKDRFAGAVLFYSLNGTRWKENTGWLSSDPICEWAGVSCVNDLLAGETVSSLNLTNNQMEGSLPSEMALMASLQIIHMPFNSISGTLPSDIGFLNQLVTMNLAGNNLSGGLPGEISGLTKLQVLDLSDNAIILQIPTEIGLLSSLRTLILSGNNIVGTIPTEVGQLRDLKELVLESCGLIGQVPTEIGFLSNLERLLLEFNVLANMPTELGNLSSLKLLSMSKNADVGQMPSEIGKLSNLEAFVIGSSGVRGSIPEEIANLKNLTILDLGDNILTGTIPARLFDMSQLEVVRLRTNGLTGNVIATNATALACLDVSYNADIFPIIDGQCPAENPTALILTTCPPEPCACCTCSDQVTGDVCLQSMRDLLWQRYF